MNSKYFNFEPQTNLIFGTNSLNSLKTELKPFGNTLLIVAQKKIEERCQLLSDEAKQTIENELKDFPKEKMVFKEKDYTINVDK